MFRLFSLFCDDDEDVEEDDDDIRSSFEFVDDVDEDVEHLRFDVSDTSYVETLFEMFDKDGDGRIDFEVNFCPFFYSQMLPNKLEK